MALPFFNKKTSPKDEPTTGAIALPEQLPQPGHAEDSTALS